MNKAKIKKAASQGNSKLCISNTGYVLAKEIVSLLSLQLMYNFSNELTLNAGVLYMQPSWYSFSSWPHSDITSSGRSVTCTFMSLPFYSRDAFGIGY